MDGPEDKGAIQEIDLDGYLGGDAGLDEDWNDAVPDDDYLTSVARSASEGLTGTMFSIGLDRLETDAKPTDLRNLILQADVRNGKVYYQVQGANREDFSHVSTITDKFFEKAKGVKREDGHKLRHELIASVLTLATTDAPLGKVFGVESGKTPDIIVKVLNPNFHMVIEVSSVSTNFHLKERYDIKLHYYYDILKWITQEKNTKIFYGILIVSPDRVSSNFYIHESLAKDLCMMWKVGEYMYEHGVANGFFEKREIQQENILDKISYELQKVITSIDFKTPIVKELTITEDYIQKIKQIEPDIALCRDHFNVALDNAKSTVMKLRTQEEKIKAWDDEMSKHIAKHSRLEGKEGETTAIKYKSVINMPLMVLPHSSYDNPTMFVEPDSCLKTIWKRCIDCYKSPLFEMSSQERTDKLRREAYCTFGPVSEAITLERQRQRKMRQHPKILGEVSHECEDYMAADGLFGKGNTDDIVEIKRAYTKIPHHWDSPVDDIEKFIVSTEPFENHFMWDESSNIAIDLLKDANERVGNAKTLPISAAEIIIGSKFFRSLQLIERIAKEVAAEIKNHVKRGHLVVKKVFGFQAFLAIYPTKSSEHIFVSIYIPKQNHQNVNPLCFFPFRQPEVNEDGWFYPFVSFKQHKLKNNILAPYMFINQVAFWMHFFKVPLSEFEENSSLSFLPSGAKSMILYSMLVFLEDKSCTEEVITRTRYMYMDLINSTGRIPIHNPSKFVSKFSDAYRSRFELYLQKKVCTAMKTMLVVPPTKISPYEENMDIEDYDDMAKDRFRNVINFITGEELESAWEIIQTYYVGYGVNKDKQTEKNGELGMMVKLIDASMQVTPDDVKEPGKIILGQIPKPQQFSDVCVKTGADRLRTRLRWKLGAAWQESLEAEILSNLTKRMSHQIASLRASCTVDFEKLKLTTTPEEMRQAKKLLEAMAENILLFDTNPFMALLKILELLETADTGLLIKLFKKAQHGGLREISILEVHGRIVALFLETISRTINGHFDEEILTHPKNKIAILEAHKRDCYEKAKSNDSTIIESSNSADKTKWNQNLTMHVLMIPLITILPDTWHPAVQRCLNLWVNKHILMPESVINLLKLDIQLSNKTYEKLRAEFKGARPDDYLALLSAPGSVFVNIQSCMMQGILHFTSSLLHLAANAVSDEIMTTILKSCEAEVKVTSVCCSDDSAKIGSIIVKRDTPIEVKRTLKVQLDFLMVASEEFTKWFSLTPSVHKSLLAASHCLEFCSEFIVANNLVQPTVKYPIAALNMNECEQFMQRQDLLYNQLSEVFGHGLPAMNTALIQVSQGLLHYSSMGCGINPLFEEFAEMLKEFPCPTLGYFLIDCNLCPGLMGLAYSNYHIQTKSGIIQVPSRILSNVEVVTDPVGMVSENYVLKMGDYYRHQKLIENLCELTTKEAEELVCKNPRLLYLLPRDAEESKTKLIIKALAPGVANSLKHGDPFLKSFQSAVYAIFAWCYSKTIIELVNGKREKKTIKVTLLGELFTRLQHKRQNPSLYEDCDERNDLIKAIFPNHALFEEFYDIVQNIRSLEVTHKPNRRSKKLVLTISSPVFAGSIRLSDILKLKWFKVPLSASEGRIRDCWDAYRKLHPWLSDDIETSLKDSPFETHVSMYYYLFSEKNQSRRIEINGPPIRAKRFITQALQIIKRNHGTDQELLSAHSDSKYIPRHKMFSELFLSTTLFDDDLIQTNCERVVNSMIISPNDIANVDSMHYKEAEVLMMIAFKKKIIDIKQIIDYMFKKGYGMIVTYIREQKKDALGQYTGPGVILLSSKDLRVQLEIMDKVVHLVKSDNRELLGSYSDLIEEKVRELGLEWDKREWPSIYFRGRVLKDLSGPRYEDFTRNDHLIKDFIDLRVVFGRKSISLVQSLSGKDFTLSRVRTHDVSITHWDGLDDLEDPIEAWVKGRKLTKDMALSVLKWATDPDDFDSQEARFYRSTFASKFNFLHTSVVKITHVVTEAARAVVISDAQIISDAMMGIAQLAEHFEGIEQAPTDTGALYGDDFLSEQHAFSSNISGVSRDSYMSVHPMWSKLMNDINPREVATPEPSINPLVNMAKKALGVYREEKTVKPFKPSWRSGK